MAYLNRTSHFHTLPLGYSPLSLKLNAQLCLITKYHAYNKGGGLT